MKRLVLGLPLILAATPAAATQGYACRTTAPAGVTLGIVVGTGPTVGVVGASLREGGRTLSTFGRSPQLVVGQSWADERTLLLDLFSPDRSRRIARLTTALGGTLESRFLNGWLEYGGRRSRIVCAPD